MEPRGRLGARLAPARIPSREGVSERSERSLVCIACNRGALDFAQLPVEMRERVSDVWPPRFGSTVTLDEWAACA
jgi:hypothetical protein